MKVYNLSCALTHSFEGWFASEEDCLSQQANGLLTCPICNSNEVIRLPSAPHIGDRLGERNAVQTQTQLEPQMQEAFLKGVRQLINGSEDVGTAFAEEARRIHYHEAPGRNIRGQTTQDEAESLREEGIQVLALPALPILKNTLQ